MADSFLVRRPLSAGELLALRRAIGILDKWIPDDAEALAQDERLGEAAFVASVLDGLLSTRRLAIGGQLALDAALNLEELSAGADAQDRVVLAEVVHLLRSR